MEVMHWRDAEVCLKSWGRSRRGELWCRLDQIHDKKATISKNILTCIDKLLLDVQSLNSPKYDAE